MHKITCIDIVNEQFFTSNDLERKGVPEFHNVLWVNVKTNAVVIGQLIKSSYSSIASYIMHE